MPQSARSYSGVLAVALALLLSELTGSGAGAEVSARADTPSYPCVARLERVIPVGARTYALETSALNSGPFDVLATLFTRARSYTLWLPNQQFVKDPARKSELLFAAPTFFTVPDDDVIEAAYADVPATIDFGAVLPCIVSRLIVSDALRPVVARVPWPTDAEREARKRLIDIFAGGARVTAAASLREVEPELSCRQPYLPARTTYKSGADYPAIAVQQGAVGTVTINVVLNRQGAIEAARLFKSSGWASLDEEARHAAASSTYAAEIFRCEAVRGFYPFVVDFTKY